MTGPIRKNVYLIRHEFPNTIPRMNPSDHLISSLVKRVIHYHDLLVWEWKGMYGLISSEVLENATSPGCRSEIVWGQSMVISSVVANQLLEYTQELDYPPAPGTSDEGGGD